MLESVEFEPGEYGFGETEPVSIELPDPSATIQFGEQLGEHLGAGDVLGLVGPLGSGKTTLVGGLVARLGSSQPARSPTYTLVNCYDTDPPVVHADLYRLESVDDLETTGYWDYVRRGDSILCVEWLDRVPAAWPGEGIVVELAHRTTGRGARIWADGSFEGAAAAIADHVGGSP